MKKKKKIYTLFRYDTEGADVAESSLVDDNLNGNSTGTSNTALPKPFSTLDAGGSNQKARKYVLKTVVLHIFIEISILY